MEQILLCADLTDHSKSALEHSIEIAKKTHARILALHAYFIPIPIGDPTFQSIQIDYNQIDEDLRKELQAVCNKVQAHNYSDSQPIVCESSIALRDPVSEIIKVAKEKSVDLIVMGSKQVPTLQKVFGTTTTQVTKKTLQPVLIIPEGCEYSGYAKVIYATDLTDDNSTIMKALEFSRIFNSLVTILHVNNPEKPEDRGSLAALKEYVLAEGKYEKIEFDSIDQKDVSTALVDYVRERGGDCLIIVKHKYPFLQKMAHKSISKDLVFNARFPILVLH